MAVRAPWDGAGLGSAVPEGDGLLLVRFGVGAARNGDTKMRQRPLNTEPRRAEGMLECRPEHSPHRNAARDVPRPAAPLSCDK